MHQAESSSSSFCLWTGLSLPAALHPASRRRSCLPLRTVQCFCPMRTFTPLLVRTFRRTSIVPYRDGAIFNVVSHHFVVGYFQMSLWD
jgi:hypothetical protein